MTSQQKPQVDFVPADVFVVDSLETLKVLADPLRLRIRELMSEPTTVKQVAKQLDLQPTKLYYHINKLEQHDLIVLVDTHVVSGIIEKYYQVSSKQVQVARHLLSPTDPSGGLDLAVNTFFDAARDDVIDAVNEGIINTDDDDNHAYQGLSLHTGAIDLTHEQAQQFYEEVGDLFHRWHELADNQTTDDETQVYRTFYALFPIAKKHTDNDV